MRWKEKTDGFHTRSRITDQTKQSLNQQDGKEERTLGNERYTAATGKLGLATRERHAGLSPVPEGRRKEYERTHESRMVIREI